MTEKVEEHAADGAARDGFLLDQDLLLALPARLNRIHGIILQQLDVPLTFRQYRTISRVASGYTSMSELAARANLTMAAVSEGVYTLVKRGFLSAVPGVEDRRTVVLKATQEGIDAVNAGTRALQKFWSFLLEDIGDTERKALFDVLERLYWRATEFYGGEANEKKGGE